MYRIALSHHDTTRGRITPHHRDTARTLTDAIEVIRAQLPGVELVGITEEQVTLSINKVNDFRSDVSAAHGDGQEWRVVIAPMM